MNEAVQPTARSQPDEIVRLKDLLFDSEERRLIEVEKSLEALDGRVGTPQRLELATSEILVEALRRAEVERHKELAGAIAPLIVAAIKNEIRNSKDMMVEALYPITGRLVSAAVSSAFRDLVQTLNQRIDHLTSAQRWKFRVQSLLTGRPVSEIALVSANTPRVIRLLFLERGSGRLLASWQQNENEEGNVDLIGGMIAAITDFARNALGNGAAELRTLDLGGQRIYLRSSPRTIVAAEYSGTVQPDEEKVLDAAFLKLIETHNNAGATSEAELGALAGHLSEVHAEPKKSNKAALAALALLALVIGFSVRPVLRAWQDYKVQNAHQVALAANPNLATYPLQVHVNHDARKIEINGLLTSQKELEQLQNALEPAADTYAFAPNVSFITTTRSMVDLEQKLNALEQRLGAAKDVAEGRAATLQTELDRLRAAQNTPDAKLRALMAGFAVFFDKETVKDEPQVRASLRDIAALIKAGARGVRVVGHADETGTLAANKLVSRRRAEAVAKLMVEEGVDSGRIIIASRAANQAVNNDSGIKREVNRRVTFEPLLEGELRP